MEIIQQDSLTVSDLIRQIALGHERTLLITSSDKKLIGVVTQGDILRALWNGAELLSPIDVCINYNPLTISEAEPKETALRMFVETGALVIPIVDQDRKVLATVNIRELLR